MAVYNVIDEKEKKEKKLVTEEKETGKTIVRPCNC